MFKQLKEKFIDCLNLIDDIKSLLILKPYPNEYACRLRPPNYKKYRRGTRESNGKIYTIIFGINPGKPSEEQAYRYKKNIWTKDQARSHCKSHKGSFDA